MLRELRTDSEALAFGVARTQRDTTHRTIAAPRSAASRPAAATANVAALG